MTTIRDIHKRVVPPPSSLLTRRTFLLGLAAGAVSLAGCQHKDADPVFDPSTVKAAGPNTIVTASQVKSAPQVTRAPVTFTDVSTPAGLHWTYSNGATGLHKFVETTGGGVAFFDFDNNGLLDIFAVQSGPIPGATADASHAPTRCVLYRNNGDGTFTDVTTGSGLDGEIGYGQGVSVADYDNDGWSDLYITSYGGSHLFHNNRNGTFTDVTTRAGVGDMVSLDHPGEHPWPLSAAWADYDNDGHLDLFVCHYCRWTPTLNLDCRNPQQQLSYCRPQVYEPSIDRLYHNNGDGTFTDVTAKAGLAHLHGKSMGAVWLDYDDDGWMDLFVTNDTMTNFLLHNNRDGTFSDRSILAGVAYGEQGSASSGMGIAVGDYTNAGREAIFVVNFSGQPKSVFANQGHGLFTNLSAAAHLSSTNLQYLGFGLECLDYDLDGRRDLVVGNGHVLDGSDATDDGSSYAQSQQLFHNGGDGTFTEDLHSLGDLAPPRVTRGLAVGDFDNDGDPDIVMVSQTGPLQLFRNDGGNQNHWLTLRLEGVQSNRDAVGAKVTLHVNGQAQTLWVHSGSSYCSHSDLRLTFGLGDSVKADRLEVRWSNGHIQQFGPLAASTFYWLREGSTPAPDPRIKHETTAPRLVRN